MIAAQGGLLSPLGHPLVQLCAHQPERKNQCHKQTLLKTLLFNKSP